MSPAVEFESWGKTPRLFRDMIITEKVDGTNAAIRIVPVEILTPEDHPIAIQKTLNVALFAQSRNRMITPENDNYGFAEWVCENADTLAQDLYLGMHYGEWWGQGIQREYDVDYRSFALFNSRKMGKDGWFKTPNVRAVPTLAKRTFDQGVIEETLRDLRENGSHLNRDFKNPEGIIVYHSQIGQGFKVTLDNNDKGKWEALETAEAPLDTVS